MTNPLPHGWTLTRVAEIFSAHGGGTPSRSNSLLWNGSIPWLSSGDIKSYIVGEATETITEAGLAESSARLCRPGSVLVVVRSGILKHTLPVAIISRRAAINQDIKCFDSGNNDLNRWLAIVLRASERVLLAENREGTTVQSVKFETLRNFNLAIPPLEELRRIVAKLEKLLDKVDSCQKRLAKIPILLKRFRQSVLAEACSGRLTADWREDNQRAGNGEDLISEVSQRRDEKLAKLKATAVANHSGSSRDIPASCSRQSLGRTEPLSRNLTAARRSRNRFSAEGIESVVAYVRG
jgi:type I restriction enzyme, S subunit